MSTHLKMLLWCLVTAGFIFGYAGLVFPDQTAIMETPRPDSYQFQRLHIFLFNLVSGGTVLLYFTHGQQKVFRRLRVYIVGSIVFSLAAFLNLYAIAIVLAVMLALIVESVRMEKFAFWPFDFFSFSKYVSQKFHHAALLCLSLGLLISAGVMLENNYLHLLHLSRLLLDDFFLGFSFPLSLMAFSVMFSLDSDEKRLWVEIARGSSFWIVTVGVIVFFVFIIAGILPLEFVTAVVLLIDVFLIFWLFRLDLRSVGEPEQFLISGMLLLVLTGVTGLLLVLWNVISSYSSSGYGLLLQTHAYLSLYGWNLSGLVVMIHYYEFPLRLHSFEVILLHWVTVAVLAPAASQYAVLALVAIPLFAILIQRLLFAPGDTHNFRSHSLSEDGG
jgi:hypothetical protein